MNIKKLLKLRREEWVGVAVVIGITIIAYILEFVGRKLGIGLLAVMFGTCILSMGYYCLISVLPKKAKERDTSISVIALRASFWLVVGGMIMVFLGFLYLMDIIPPSGW